MQIDTKKRAPMRFYLTIIRNPRMIHQNIYNLHEFQNAGPRRSRLRAASTYPEHKVSIYTQPLILRICTYKNHFSVIASHLTPPMPYIYLMLNLVLASCLAYLAYYYLKTYFQQPRTERPMLPYLAPEIAPGPIDNHTKGVAFERFVVGHFDKHYFELIDWRGDKYHEGVYPLSNCYPDLVMRYRPAQIQFAVECKWRQNFYEYFDKKDHDQINNYKKFSAEKKMKVFLVIGIGGTPHYPDNLYIVPLRDVSSYRPLFSAAFLEHCQKKPGNFFLHPKTIQLK